MVSFTQELPEVSPSLDESFSQRRAPRCYASGALVIDLAAREVHRAGKRVVLTLKEFALLWHFHEHAGVVLTREALVADVWASTPGSRRRVDICVRRLREKLAGLPALETCRGYGYVFRAEVEPDPPRPGRVPARDDVADPLA